MKRSNRILLSLFAAAVTFAGLYAFTGRPPGFDQRGYPHNREGCVEGSHKKSANHAERSARDQAPPKAAPNENQ